MAIKVKYVERLFVENEPVIGWIQPPDIVPALLRLARAASMLQPALVSAMRQYPMPVEHCDGVVQVNFVMTAKEAHEFRQALDAFDFSEEKP